MPPAADSNSHFLTVYTHTHNGICVGGWRLGWLLCLLEESIKRYSSISNQIYIRKMKAIILYYSTLDQLYSQFLRALDGEPLPLLALITAGVYLGKRLLNTLQKSHNIASIIAKRIETRDSIVHECLSKDPMENLDLRSDGQTLHSLYKRGKISASDVVIHCCKQSKYIGRDFLCAVTEELYDEAYKIAATLDREAKKDDEFSKTLKRKPLWGIPVSIKDCIKQKGTDATCGSVAKCLKPHAEDGLQVSLLRNAGAILHVRSNVPQLLMMPESENNVWGVSKNPWDVSRTPGGSSGGEAALIASGCSVMGLGSDIGGSIRIPAHYCGLVGFKPTPMRITTNGSVAPRYEGRNGQLVIKPVVGPIARSVKDCVSMMQALTAPEAYESDCFLPPLPSWNTSLSTKGPSNKGRPMRIGVVLSDDWFEAADACQRAVQMAADTLSSQVLFNILTFRCNFFSELRASQ